jgi:hypothetical protein
MGYVSPKNLFGLRYSKEFIGLPGGAHGIYSTFQATVALFNEDHSYLIGETFVNYIPQAIPGFIIGLLGITPPPGYRPFLREQYNYIGGNFFLNVYYANFGPGGILIGGFVLAAIVITIRHYLEKSPPHTSVATAIAAILYINVFRSLWYTQLNWVDAFQGLGIGLSIYITGKIGRFLLTRF